MPFSVFRLPGHANLHTGARGRTAPSPVRSGWIRRSDPTPANSALLVFGSEGSGVSDILAAASTRIRIPTSGQVESLNVASAAVVLLEASYRGRAGS
ncbi:MAG TPA: TrmH family RNA methyltransferase [Thermoanaerobaculia bacterium]|nr:TrmH family RNA methyltransferase [Thermoanaerobaculia bacterium]